MCSINESVSSLEIFGVQVGFILPTRRENVPSFRCASTSAAPGLQRMYVERVYV